MKLFTRINTDDGTPKNELTIPVLDYSEPKQDDLHRALALITEALEQQDQ